jgi:hypothetical protein
MKAPPFDLRRRTPTKSGDGDQIFESARRFAQNQHNTRPDDAARLNARCVTILATVPQAMACSPRLRQTVVALQNLVAPHH